MPQKNLKILISGDSKPFRQSVDQGAQSMKKFQGEASSAMQSLAQAVGINTGQINGALNSMQNVVGGLSGAFKGAAASSGILTKAMKILKVALISTGVGALVVALGTLIAYLTGSQRGADKLSIFMAKLRAAVDVVKDRFVQFGEGLALIFSGKFKAGADLMKNAFKGIGDEMQQEIHIATELEKRRAALERREIEFIKTKSKLSDQISDLILKTRDEAIAEEERLKYIKQAQELQKQIVSEEYAIAQERTNILREQQALGENLIADDRELAEAEANLNEVRRQGNDKLRELVNRENEMTNRINAQTTALLKNAKAAEEKFLKAGGFSNTKIQAPTIDGKVQGIQLAPVDVTPHESAADGMKKTWVDATNEVNGAMQGMAANFGEAIGLMVAGEEGAKSIGNVVLVSMADLAINVGKIAIATGFATKAMKKALLSFGGAGGAIAAGAALVALGTAVKSSLANAASSFGSGSGAVSGADAGSLNNTYTGPRQSEKLHIEVTGAITANGRDMALVLSKENVRVNKV